MDINDSLLSALEVQVEPFAVCDVRDGCHLELKADPSNTIHYVLSGTGYLTTERGDTISLQADQMLVVPRGLSHRIDSAAVLSDQECTKSICLQPSESLAWLKSGEGDTDIVLACGRVHVTYGQETNLFGLLDQPLVESFDNSPYIRGAFEAILHEFCKPQLGTLALTGTLMKQCLILLFRRLREQQDWRMPWLAVLDSRGLQNALRAILEAPEKQYQVEDLADLALMSRSAFSIKFTKALGQSPHEFLSNYRLRLAAQLLATTDRPIKSIASQVGFQSRSSFSRAFKSLYKMDPAGYRKIMIES